MSAGAPRTAAARIADPDLALRFLGVPILALLLLEFLLGMTLNLLVPLPTGSPLAILGASPPLVAHLLVGVLILGATGRATVLGLRGRDRRGAVGGGLAFLSSVVAVLAGLSFTFGNSSSAASFLMSVGFAGAALGATLLLWPRPSVPAVASPGVPTSGDGGSA